MSTTQPHNQPQPTASIEAVTIHPATEIGSVTFKVANLERSLAFYTGLVGLQVLTRSDDKTAILGTGTHPILRLEEIPNAQPRVERTTGLYHAAILLPTRRDLAVKVNQIANIRYPLGHGDHLVSEAFYLDDPDGNGLEIYRDRPRNEWTWKNGLVQMATDPIDFDGLAAELEGADLNQIAMPVGTKLGHMHLKVADVAKTEAFYHGILGFDVTAHMPSAIFMSAGGYHHHLGANTWHSLGAGAATESSVGLRDFSILLPDEAEQTRLAKRLDTAGIAYEWDDKTIIVYDPFRNKIRLEVRAQAA